LEKDDKHKKIELNDKKQVITKQELILKKYESDFIIGKRRNSSLFKTECFLPKLKSRNNEGGIDIKFELV
jgi:hypothetical protein